MEGMHLVRKGFEWLGSNSRSRLDPRLAADAMRSVGVHLREASEQLRMFVDAQLLISAQTTSRQANALYGAAALDLPRRGVVHVAGGMGEISQVLAQAVEQNGGQVLYRHEVQQIVRENGHPVAVKTKRGETFSADLVVANLPPWNVASLLDGDLPPRLRRLPPRPKAGWGAFMVYVGLDRSIIPDGYPLHHQVVLKEPLGEGNTVFLSLSPAWDDGRAPKDRRTLTISTHTRLADWWDLFDQDRATYDAHKVAYTKRVLDAAEVALPGLADAAELVLPGTPVTFHRFTRRYQGWVGGFPQTDLFRAWGPRLGPGLWMVGDSIFPGQSTAAVGLGGLRVGQSVARELERSQNSADYSLPLRTSG
jgi:phytoene dehydrogenase-like protein